MLTYFQSDNPYAMHVIDDDDRRLLYVYIDASENTANADAQIIQGPSCAHNGEY